MTWFKVDDLIMQHRKFLGIGDAALAAWLRCGVWCAQQGTDGDVPAAGLVAFGVSEETADDLIGRGLWERTDDGGVRFHAWAEYQPTREERDAKRDAERGRKRRQRRNSAGKYVSRDEVPDDWDDFTGGDSEARHAPVPHVSHRDTDGTPAPVPHVSHRDTDGTPAPVPHVSQGCPTVPDPTRPDPYPTVSPDGETTPDSHESEAPPVENPPREDVDRICQHMADSVRDRTGRRPNITKAWRDAARLLLDRDKHTEADVHAAIDWAAADEFWRANVLSLPTLRKQYDRLSLQAQRTHHRAPELGIVQPATDDEAAALVNAIYTPRLLQTIQAEEAAS